MNENFSAEKKEEIEINCYRTRSSLTPLETPALRDEINER